MNKYMNEREEALKILKEEKAFQNTLADKSVFKALDFAIKEIEAMSFSETKIVISLSKETYKDIKEERGIYSLDGGLIPRITGKIVGAIQSGTPLPEKHEKQIDDLWIYVKWHEITDKERQTEDYPQDQVVYIDSPMPADEEEILVYTKYGAILRDVSYIDRNYRIDNGYSLDSGYDWVEDVIAWMPLSSLIPKSYRKAKCNNTDCIHYRSGV